MENIGVEIYNIKELKEKLERYNIANNIDSNAGITCLLNTCKIYNATSKQLDFMEEPDTKLIYLIVQLNSQIIKSLQLYGVMPSLSRKSQAVKSTSKLSKLKK